MAMEGTRNATRLELPGRVRTAVAGVCTVGATAGGFGVNVTVTFDGGIVPEGKLIPVTLTLVNPGSATAGDVFCCNVTTLWAFRPARLKTAATASNEALRV